MRSRVPVDLFVRKVMLHNPALALKLGKALYHKHVRADKDYAKKTGLAYAPPVQVSLRITNVCNHRCAVCGQYGLKGYMKGEKGKELLKVLPKERYMQLIDEIAPHKPILYVTGGEAFLYPGIMEVMNYAKKKGLIVSIVTNGVHLKEKAEEIVRNKWDMVLVSFDGPEEIHDKCRNFKGAFKASYEGLLELQKWKKQLNSTLPFVLTSTTLSKTNADYLEECFKIGETINPDLMILYPSWFTSEEVGKRHEKILKEELDVEAYTWKSYVTSFSKEDAKKFADAVKRVKARKWPFDYFIIPDMKEDQFEPYYCHPENFLGYAKCVAPFIMVDVMPNGDVTTCRDFIDVVVGNIMEKPLLEIWNDEKFVAFRKLLIKQGGLLPQCSRCCGLMGF